MPLEDTSDERTATGGSRFVWISLEIEIEVESHSSRSVSRGLDTMVCVAVRSFGGKIAALLLGDTVSPLYPQAFPPTCGQ